MYAEPSPSLPSRFSTRIRPGKIFWSRSATDMVPSGELSSTTMSWYSTLLR